MSVTNIKVNADPTKEFFIHMLTRDISLTDCILDLIDNSIDSIIQKTNFDPMVGLFKKPSQILKGYNVTISCSKNKFIIEDNSSGLKSNEIKNNSFRFGTDSGSKKKVKGLSVYGIGMKRAFLKIGKNIIFKSTNSKEVVDVEIDVKEWLDKKEDWNFNGISTTKKSSKTGTKIEISDLNEEIVNNFSSERFKTKLFNKISEVYGIFILNGLTIKLNNKKTIAHIPKIAHSTILKPAIETIVNDGVTVKIIAGITHEDSKDLNGWYIFCNGRLILSGDKTEKTGWGNGLRKFHPSTNRFIGFVYFESDEVIKLPWTTTKDGVNYDSIIYQYALKEMVKNAVPVVAFLTSQYNQDTSLQDLRSVIKKTQEISMEDIKKINQKFKPPNISISKKTTMEKIIYSVQKKDLDKARKLMKNIDMPKKEVGETTFDYYIEHEE